MISESTGRWDDDVSVEERFARLTRAGARATVADPTFGRLLAIARPLAWAIHTGFAEDARAASLLRHERCAMKAGSALGFPIASLEYWPHNDLGYLGSAPWFDWLATFAGSDAERDALAAPWRLLADRLVPDWAGPRTGEVEAMLATARRLDLAAGRRMAAARAALGQREALRAALFTAVARDVDDVARHAGIAAGNLAGSVVRNVLGTAMAGELLNHAAMAADDACSVLVFGEVVDSGIARALASPWAIALGGSGGPVGSSR